jgi:flagellar hook-basal body complex protein FliE
MTNPISGLGNLQSFKLPMTVNEFSGSSGNEEMSSFQHLLLDSLQQTSALAQSAEQTVESSLSGNEITQIEDLSAVKKADLALRMMLQIRNILLDGFNEIKQMQL